MIKQTAVYSVSDNDNVWFHIGHFVAKVDVATVNLRLFTVVIATAVVLFF